MRFCHQSDQIGAIAKTRVDVEEILDTVAMIYRARSRLNLLEGLEVQGQ